MNCSNSSSTGLDYAMCLDQAEADFSCPDPSLCNISDSEGNLALAFGLTIGAGLATTLGALLPFVPCIRRSNTQFLAVGLGLAAGVMLYVSFTEIWKKSRDNFCCVTPDHFDLAVTGCFFGGILLTVVLDLVVGGLQRLDCGCSRVRLRARSRGRSCRRGCSRCCCSWGGHPEDGKVTLSASNGSVPLDKSHAHTSMSPEAVDDVSCSPSTCGDSKMLQAPVTESETQQCPPVLAPDCTSISVSSMAPSDNTINCVRTVSVSELFSSSSMLRMNATIPESVAEEGGGAGGMEEKGEGPPDSTSHVIMPVEDKKIVGNGVSVHHRASYQEMSEQLSSSSMEEALGPEEFKEVTEGLGKSTKKLHRMGILTGLAIGIHNFPEGLATFVAALSSPSLGAALAVAIALHNIPEGLCVAMPVYYATGKRWKGFLWAFFSGISEPFGALLGWLVLRDLFGPLVYGISFGLISGMMVFISLKELLPTAFRFDRTKGRLVTGCLAVGMLVMAVSLILFLY